MTNLGGLPPKINSYKKDNDKELIRLGKQKHVLSDLKSNSKSLKFLHRQTEYKQ